MNTLSKVFVVVNLVLAVAFCFMTLTLYSKRVDWKQKHELQVIKYNRFADEKKREIAALEDKNTALKHNLELAEQQKNELGQANADLNEQVKQKSVKAFEADQERRLLSDRMDAAQLELKRRYEHIERMHRIILTQQRALEIAKTNMQNAMSRSMEMENETNNARLQLVAVQKEKARLEKDLHHQSWVIDTLMRHGVPIRDIVYGAEAQPTKPIHGKVLAVRPEVNLVMISVGSDDQVRKGYRFTVYRGERYVGKVEVEKVFIDMCSARILTDWTKEKIKEGDEVSTGIGGG